MIGFHIDPAAAICNENGQRFFDRVISLANQTNLSDAQLSVVLGFASSVLLSHVTDHDLRIRISRSIAKAILDFAREGHAQPRTH
jgi:hypothetical protein